MNCKKFRQYDLTIIWLIKFFHSMFVLLDFFNKIIACSTTLLKPEAAIKQDFYKQKIQGCVLQIFLRSILYRWCVCHCLLLPPVSNVYGKASGLPIVTSMLLILGIIQIGSRINCTFDSGGGRQKATRTSIQPIDSQLNDIPGNTN
jgi:hypothetical protein